MRLSIRKTVQSGAIALFMALLLMGVSLPLKTSSPQEPIKIAQAQRLKAHVSFMSEIQPARNYQNLQSLHAVGTYIEKHFKEAGLEPARQYFKVEDNSYFNVHAIWGDPKLPRMVVGAHYDVEGNKPGADDNASGVAGILELSNLLASGPPPKTYCIEFVAYTLEEPPFFNTENMGSYIHAQSLHEKQIEVLGMLSIEMIGYFTDAPGSQRYPLDAMKHLYSDRGDYIAVVSNLSNTELVGRIKAMLTRDTGLKVQALIAPSALVGVNFSDHLNYWEFDYPALMITDTAFYRNHHYHTKDDTLEKLNFRAMAELVDRLFLGLKSFQ